MMFFMVLRGFKLLLDSTHPMLSTPRVQMKALGMGLFKIFLVFVLLNFIMGFFSLLAMSLIGSKGDFHNRCAVPVYKNGTFTYEPLVPEVVCRMDHLYDLNTDGCFGDVWDYEPPSSDPKAGFVPTSTDKNKRPRAGCQGTCAGVRYFSNTSLGREINLNAVGIDNQGNPAIGNQVYCIGPDFVPLDKTGMKLPPKSAGAPGAGAAAAALPKRPLLGGFAAGACAAGNSRVCATGLRLRLRLRLRGVGSGGEGSARLSAPGTATNCVGGCSFRCRAECRSTGLRPRDARRREGRE